jgi:hypothetical protein
MRRRHRSIALVFGLLAAVTVAPAAAAASPWLTIREHGVSAMAQRADCADHGATLACEAELFVAFKGTIKVTGSPTVHTDQVCYLHVQATVDPDTGDLIDSTEAVGCALDTGKVRIRSIGSIVVGSTRIDLVSATCDENGCTETAAGHVTVRGSWSSAGRPAVSRFRFRFDDGFCTDVISTQGRQRIAAFRGFVDGSPMTADEALTGSGNFRIQSQCLDAPV